MKKKLMLLLSCLLISAGIATAQTTKVSGTVVDETGEPIISASVVVKGTTVGTSTDLDGKFTLNLPSESNTLVFHLIGMKSIEKIAKDGMRVVLEEDQHMLGEVEIVVPYGSVKKTSFTGAAGVMTGDKVGKLQVSSISKALEGAVPGLQAASVSGQPGDDATLRIRGVGSISAGNSPLIVLDGVVFDGKMNSINSQDIESISVLKDAASGALYGSRAANGVIMITTKKGHSGKTKVTLDVKQGLNTRGVPTYDIMTDAGEYLQTYWGALYNTGRMLGETSPGQYASDNLISTLGGYNPYLNVANNAVVDSNGNLVQGAKKRYSDNWNDELFKTSYRQEYNVAISGGNENLTSYLSLGYLNDEGIVRGTGYERYSLRTNLGYKVNKYIDLGANLAYANTVQNTIKSPESASSLNNSFSFASKVAPIYPVYMYDLDGSRMYDKAGNVRYDYGDVRMPGVGERKYASNQNPLAAAYDDQRKLTADNVVANGYLNIKFLDGFKFSTNLGYNLTNTNQSVFYNDQFGDAQGLGRVQKKVLRQTTLTANQILNYTKTFDKVHNVSALVGHESYSYTQTTLDAQKNKILTPGGGELNNAIVTDKLDSYTGKKKIESYLSQVLYDYDNKYYFSASMRRDGSSVFHKDSRWGNFWSVGGSWRLSQEAFMQSTKSWLDDFKLRASYGVQGNDAINDEDGYPVYKAYEGSWAVSNNNGDISLVQVYNGNKDLKWETNKVLNFGLDFAVLNGRLNFEFDYFIRNAEDLLYNKPQPLSEGISYIPMNIGDMRNTGIEFTVSGDIIRTPDLVWNMSLTGFHSKNKITKLPEEVAEQGIRSAYSILRVGGTIYDYYLPQSAGVDPDTGKALWYYTNAAGNRATTDVASNTANDRKVSGTAMPDFSGGLNTTLTYKEFDLSIMTNFQIGGKVLDRTYSELMHGGNIGNNWHKDIKKAWSVNNKGSNIPMVYRDYRDANTLSDRFLIGADFFNIRNITLGYTFNKNLLQPLMINGLRVYFAADNVALFSQRKGLDPRQAMSSGLTGRSTVSGASSYSYSPIRALSLGLTANF